MTTTTIQVKGGRPLSRDWVMKRNSDFNKTMKILEDDRVTPKPTTDWVMQIPIRDGKAGPIYVTLSTEGASPLIQNTAATGTFLVHVPAETINTYKFQRAHYDVILINAEGNQIVFMSGEIEMLP